MTIHRILLADRDESLLDRYRDFLSDNGFQVETVTSEKECLRKIGSFKPDVLILEPEMTADGGDDLVLARKEPGSPLLRVMVLSSDLDPQWLYRVRGLPVSAYYVKPIAPRDLVECVQRLREPLAVGT